MQGPWPILQGPGRSSSWRLDGCKVAFREFGGAPTRAPTTAPVHSGALPTESLAGFVSCRIFSRERLRLNLRGGKSPRSWAPALDILVGKMNARNIQSQNPASRRLTPSKIQSGALPTESSAGTKCSQRFSRERSRMNLRGGQSPRGRVLALNITGVHFPY